MTNLMPSMLRSFVDVDGEALVMHAGDKPYVVTPRGKVELANRPLSMDAVKRIVSNLLPTEVARALEEFGAVQHEIVSPPEFPGESFTVVATRGNDDMWVEIRRRKVGVGAAPEVTLEPAAQRLAIAATVRRGAEAARLRRASASKTEIPDPPMTILSAMAAAPPPVPQPPAVPPPAPPAPSPAKSAAAPVVVPPPAVVLPTPIEPERHERTETGPPSSSTLDRLLRLASTRGASTLYLSSGAPPSVRVEGEVAVLEGEPLLRTEDVESLLLAAVPDAQYESLRRRRPVEWTRDVEGVGRVRCTTFRDLRGAGCVLRIPARATSTGQLGLTREVASLALERGGLVLVTGPRHSGKRTIISALVDLMNRRRHDRMITIEREVGVVHEPGTALISQREVDGGDDDFEVAVRSALREEPDVLVIETLSSPAVIDIALEAAASGQLVVGGLTARDSASAVERIVNSFPLQARRQAQLSLAEHLRGIVAQAILQKRGGGRVVAREVLFNTPVASRLIAEGRTSELAGVMDAAKEMQRLNDALADLVQRGVVDVAEAYRNAVDREGLVAKLKRLGVDLTALGL
jgi:twitching motility protein PilT